MEERKGLKVLQLEAENFKALTAVEITPTGNIVTVSGANGSGKSSTLDSIWAAIDAAGFMKATKTVKPIKGDAKRGIIKLHLGPEQGEVELIVTRKFNPGGISVEVENGDGQVFKSPQAILDALTGAISFDPLSFAMLKQEEQKKQLLSLVEISVKYQGEELTLDDWAAKRKEIYDARTLKNKEKDAAETLFLSTPKPAPDTPEEEVSAAEIVGRMNEAQKVINQNNEKRQALSTAESNITLTEGSITTYDERITALSDRIKDLTATLNANIAERSGKVDSLLAQRKQVETLSAEVAGLNDPDLSTFQQELDTLEETNKSVRAKIQREDNRILFDKHKREAQEMTDAIEDLDTAKSDAIKATHWPVAGLGFDDNGITFNGVPFTQASSAQRLRVSLAIAIALNPRLRVLRITDGSLLDSKSLAIIEEMCAEHGYQAWVERVDETGKVGIYIEEGAIAARNEA